MVGRGLFSKFPAKKAMADFGLCELTIWEGIWYVVECLWLGVGYLPFPSRRPSRSCRSIAVWVTSGHWLEQPRCAAAW